MKTIWKFSLEMTDDQLVEMPKGAMVLSVQTQHEKPCLWALVDPDQKREERKISIRGTGHPIHGDLGAFIGTFQMHGGALIFHAFDGGAP